MNLLETIRAYGTSEGVKKAWESRPRALAAQPPFQNVFKEGSGTYQVFEKLKDGEWHKADETGADDVKLARIAFHGLKNGFALNYGPNGTIRVSPLASNSASPEQATLTAAKLLDMCGKAAGGQNLTAPVLSGIAAMATGGLHPDLVNGGLKSLQVVTDANLPESLKSGAAGVFDPKTESLTVRGSADPSTFVHEMGHMMDYRWLKPENSIAKPGAPALAPSSQVVARNDMHTEFWNTKQKAFGDNAPAHGGGDVWSKKTNAASNYALTNNREWFAEHFKSYFMNPDGRAAMQKNSPVTYSLIDNFVRKQK